MTTIFMPQENFKISSSQELKEEETKTAERVRVMRDYLFGLPGKRIEVNEKISEIAEELEKKYPELIRQTYLFHIMSYSTIKREECANFDLSGEDSIIKRLENLVKEYETE